jgi:FtsP/CotA-like multicopper oxidase with cupredoxin domain
MGERYDVLLEANNPGSWTIMAAPLEVRAAPAEAVLRYTDAVQSRSMPLVVPDGIRRGRVLELHDLRANDGAVALSPDRRFDLALSGGMMSSQWTINGRAYLGAAPLDIHEGEVVRFRMVNHSMMLHPMHLHGHFFQVGGALKDTVIVPPHMGRVTFDFVADNPGRWFFHCHNIYHLEAGMAREIRYV